MVTFSKHRASPLFAIHGTAAYRSSSSIAALCHPWHRGIPFILEHRRSLPSMAPRHTVHPEHKKGLLMIAALFLCEVLVYTMR